jgi:uncharacterized protein DUF4388
MSERRSVSEIQSDTVPNLMHRLHREGRTGRLFLQQGPLEKTVDFQDGLITFAGSNDRDDRLMQVFVKRGMVTLPELMGALEIALKNRERLGEVLLARKKIQEEDLERALQEQLKEIIFSVFDWTAGGWAFEGAPDSPERIQIHAHPLELVLEGVRRTTSLARVYEIVGGLSTEYLSTEEAPALAAKADLMPGERQILTFCRETRTLSEICESVPMNDFVLCKVVWGLLVVGALMKA